MLDHAKEERQKSNINNPAEWSSGIGGKRNQAYKSDDSGNAQTDSAEDLVQHI